MARRERLTILLETLERIDENAERGESRTQLAARCNLPYDRFLKVVVDLTEQGLLIEGPRLTAHGRHVLEQWRQLRRLLRTVRNEPSRDVQTARER